MHFEELLYLFQQTKIYTTMCLISNALIIFNLHIKSKEINLGYVTFHV